MLTEPARLRNAIPAKEWQIDVFASLFGDAETVAMSITFGCINRWIDGSFRARRADR
jgi:hypothetical protein